MILLILLLSLAAALGAQALFVRCGLAVRPAARRDWLKPWLLRTLFLCLWLLLLLMLTHFDFFAPFSFRPLKLLVAAGGLLLACVLELLLRLHRRCARKSRRTALLLLIALLFSLGLEFFLFNARSIQSFYYEPVDLLPSVQNTIHNGSYDEAGDVYLYDYIPPEDPSFQPALSPRLVLNIRDVEVDIQNLYIDVRAAYNGQAVDELTVSLSLDDDGTSQMFTTPSRSLFRSVPRSRYIPMQSVGITTKLMISLTADAGEIQVLSLMANVPQPLDFSPLRVLVCMLLALLLYTCRPSSPLYTIAMLKGSRRQALIALLLVAALALGSAAVIINYLPEGDPALAYSRSAPLPNSEYQRLARQLAEGKTWLPEDAPAYLLEMENPYDTVLRQQLQASTGESYLWDTAFYNGRYYVYFGVVPVLLMYLPYYLITGADLSNFTVMAVLATLFIAALFILVRKLYFRFAGGGSFLGWLLMSSMLCFGCGLIVLLTYPTIYTVPILCALTLTVCGLSLWLGALEKDTLSTWRLALGSLCMALVAGCRPQMLLFSFLALPLFWDEVFKKRSLLALKKKPLIRTLCFALPYVAVAAGLMYYNFIRFGSPFDFGANYNLTTNDMTVRGFNFERCGSAVFNYLLQMPSYTSAYPFLQESGFNTGYMGVNIYEPTYGGVFFAQPFVLLSLLLYRRRGQLRENRAYPTAMLLFVSGILVALVDAQMAGILHRYFADFTLMFYLAALILYSVWHRDADEPVRRRLNGLLFGCTLLSAFRALCILFLFSSESIIRSFEFWL